MHPTHWLIYAQVERPGSFSGQAGADASEQGVGRDETRPAAGTVGRNLQAVSSYLFQRKRLHGAEFEAVELESKRAVNILFHVPRNCFCKFAFPANRDLELSEYPSVSYWSKEINGTRTGGQK